MEKQSKQTELTWLDTEIAEQQTNQPMQGERLPTLKLEPKKLTPVEIDTSAPFGK